MTAALYSDADVEERAKARMGGGGDKNNGEKATVSGKEEDNKEESMDCDNYEGVLMQG